MNTEIQFSELFLTKKKNKLIMCYISSVILPKPSVFVMPVGKVTWGHRVSITCSISTQHLGGTFTLQQSSGSFRKSQTSSTNSASFNITEVNFSNEGSYQCQYQTRVSSQDFSSPKSDPVGLMSKLTLSDLISTLLKCLYGSTPESVNLTLFGELVH
uniref:Ig-like domain-containing protein n=1 Tax=Pundamilia nyererei TaxID=303518 RepID=A0A3B4GDC4_9CICH